MPRIKLGTTWREARMQTSVPYILLLELVMGPSSRNPAHARLSGNRLLPENVEILKWIGHVRERRHEKKISRLL